MRATFYEALEVPSTSESSTIRSALRAILRRYWSVPRDPSGDTEEAVRFVALGAAILGDERRREEYDAQARRGATTNPWRVGNDGTALGAADAQALGLPGSHGGESGQLSITPGESRLLPAVHALTDPLPEKERWENAVALVFALLFALGALGFAFWSLASLLPTMIAAGVLVAVLVAATVIGFQLQVVSNELSGFTLARLVVTKWRRESSVFIGNPPPAQDTAWIFRLRVMELTRSAAGYSSAPNTAIRVFARLTDYALVASMLVVLLSVLQALLPATHAAIDLLLSPVGLPVLAVLLAIPIEAYALAQWRTTPGKFLMGVVVVLAITQPDDRESPSRAQLALARALTAARSGMFFGVWPIVLARLGALEKALRVTEASWDAAGDSVVVCRPAPPLMRSAAVTLVLAVSVGLIGLWAGDAIRIGQDVKRWWSSQPVPSPTSTPTATLPTAQTPVSPDPSAVAAAPSPAPTPPAPTAAQATQPASPTPVPAVPPPTAASSEFERQTALAQARRNRIDAAEKRVAAARASGNYAGLQGVCERWTEDQPGSAEAWRCLGLARAQAGAGRDALPALRQALKLDPNDAQVEAAIFKILRP